MSDTRYITKEKKRELEIELDDLINVKRPALIKRVQAARELGDLKENTEYHTSRDDQSKMVARIGEIEFLLKDAKIIEHKGGDEVQLGSEVFVQEKKDKENKTFYIVGMEEIDIAEGKISHTSPIGSALLGKKKGEDAIVETPSGKIIYKIIKIN